MREKLADALVNFINAITNLINTATFLSFGIMILVMFLAKNGMLSPDKIYELALMVFTFYFSAKAYTKAYEETMAKMTKTTEQHSIENFNPYPTKAQEELENGQR